MADTKQDRPPKSYAFTRNYNASFTETCERPPEFPDYFDLSLDELFLRGASFSFLIFRFPPGFSVYPGNEKKERKAAKEKTFWRCCIRGKIYKRESQIKNLKKKAV